MRCCSAAVATQRSVSSVTGSLSRSSASSQLRCSAHSRSRSASMLGRSVVVMLISLSPAMPRPFRLAEPTVPHSSSITAILAWT